MSLTTFFQRADGTGYPFVFMGRAGEAIAVGNGFDAYSPSDPNYQMDAWTRNSFAHA